jgi:O-antigen/teichoic acid export membrane protein
LRRNTLAGGAGAIAGIAVSAISYPVYLHFLGYEQYGLWLAVSVVISFAAFGHLGLAPAVATTVAAEYAKGDLAGVRKTVSTSLIALSAIGLTAVACILLCGHWFIAALHLRPTLAAQARMLLPFVAMLSLYVVQIDTINAVLVGLGRLDLSVATLQGGRVFSFVLAVALLLAGRGVMSLPIAYLAGNVFVHITSLVLARKITEQGCFRLSAFNFAHLRSLMAYGSGVVAASLINFLLSPLSKFALTRYVGTSAVPVYDMAFTMTMQLRGVLDSGFSSLMPEVSRLKALVSDEARLRIRSTYGQAMKLILGIGLPLFGGAIILAHVALQFWLGSRFRPDLVPALRVLLLGGFVSLVGVPGYHIILGVRKVKLNFAGFVLQSGVNAVALGFLCYFGLLSGISAACAASASIAAGGLYFFFSGRSVSRAIEQHRI